MRGGIYKGNVPQAEVRNTSRLKTFDIG
jgi:hypothetical protein